MATITLLSLPDELLIQILSYLPPSDVLSAQLTSHHLNSTVTNSVWLQYRTLLKAAQYTDNPSSSLGIRDRLSALKTREEAWSSLRPTFTREIEVPQPTYSFDIAGGAYRLKVPGVGSNPFWVQLPTQEGDEKVWWMIDMGLGLFVLDIFLSVHEHDLMAVVTTSLHPSMPATNTTKLHLLQFSAAASSSRPTPHPLATQNQLHILDSRFGKPDTCLEIVGDHLVLIINMLYARDDPDRVFVWNWRSGHMVAGLNAPCRSYHGLVFLTERWFLLPNAREGKLEVYEIPSKAYVDDSIGIELAPIHILALPALADGRDFIHITCRGYPNPISERCTKLRTTIPCYPCPEDAILIFIFHVMGAQIPSGQGHPEDPHGLSMYVHRRALLEVCRTGTTARSPADHPSTEPPPPCSLGAPTAPPIPYRAWGPPVTRWFNTDEMHHRRTTTTAGQRAVIISQSAFEDAAPYIVLDFNQGNVRRAQKVLGHRSEEANFDTEADDMVEVQDDNWEDVGSDSSDDVFTFGAQREPLRWSELTRIRDLAPEYPYAHPFTHSPDPDTPPNRWVTAAFHPVQPTDLFDPSEGLVGGSLPYVACSSAKGYKWDSAMIDAERVVGVLAEGEIERRLRKVQVDGFG